MASPFHSSQQHLSSDSSHGSTTKLANKGADSDAFEKLLLSQDTVKLTSTPDRLKTIEIKRTGPALKLEAKPAAVSVSNAQLDEPELTLEEEIMGAVGGSASQLANKKKKQETYWEFLRNTGPEEMGGNTASAKLRPMASPSTPPTLGSNSSLAQPLALGNASFHSSVKTGQNGSKGNSPEMSRSNSNQSIKLDQGLALPQRTMTSSSSVPTALNTVHSGQVKSKPSKKSSSRDELGASAALDDDDEDAELFGKKKKNQEMSLADFLRDSEPPPPATPQANNNNTTVRKKNTGIMGFLGNLSKSKNELSSKNELVSSRNELSAAYLAQSTPSLDQQEPKKKYEMIKIKQPSNGSPSSSASALTAAHPNSSPVQQSYQPPPVMLTTSSSSSAVLSSSMPGSHPIRRASSNELKAAQTFMTQTGTTDAVPPVPPVPVQYGDKIRVGSMGAVHQGVPTRSKSHSRIQQLNSSANDLVGFSGDSRSRSSLSHVSIPSGTLTRRKPKPVLNLPEPLADVATAPLEKVFKQLTQINDKFSGILELKAETRKSVSGSSSPTLSSRATRKVAVKLPVMQSSPVGSPAQSQSESPTHHHHHQVRRHVFSQTERLVFMENDTQTRDPSDGFEDDEDGVVIIPFQPVGSPSSRKTFGINRSRESLLPPSKVTPSANLVVKECVEKETVASCQQCHFYQHEAERVDMRHYCRSMVEKMLSKATATKRRVAQTQTAEAPEQVETELQTLPISLRTEEEDQAQEKTLHDLVQQTNQLHDDMTNLRLEAAREKALRDTLTQERDTLYKRLDVLAKICLGVIRNEAEKRFELELEVWEKSGVI